MIVLRKIWMKARLTSYRPRADAYTWNSIVLYVPTWNWQRVQMVFNPVFDLIMGNTESKAYATVWNRPLFGVRDDLQC